MLFLPIVFPFGGFGAFLAGYGIGRVIRERSSPYPYYWGWYASRYPPVPTMRYPYYAARYQAYAHPYWRWYPWPRRGSLTTSLLTAPSLPWVWLPII